MGYTILMIVTIIVGNLQQQIYYTSPPKYVNVNLNTNVYPSNKMSYIQVFGPDGEEVSVGDCSYVGTRTMRIPIRDEGAGVYVVLWNALTTDDMLEHQGVRTFAVYQINIPFVLLAGFFTASVLSMLFFFRGRYSYAHRK